jgi:hypothetical protein
MAGQQLLVVRVVGLHDRALAELLEALDRLRRKVVVPVVELELVPGGERRERDQQRSEKQGESFHELFWQMPSRPGETLEAG